MPGSRHRVRASAKALNDYFEQWLGTNAESERKMVQLVEAGLPIAVLNHLIEGGLSQGGTAGKRTL